MQPFSVQRANQFLGRADNSLTGRFPALRRILPLIFAMLKFRSRAECTEEEAFQRYRGRAWCDSTERQLNQDISSDPRAGL
jgi:hypothetical protein